jgi:hypothetical protein
LGLLVSRVAHEIKLIGSPIPVRNNVVALASLFYSLKQLIALLNHLVHWLLGAPSMRKVSLTVKRFTFS